MCFTTETSRGALNAKFYLSYNILLPQRPTPDSLPPLPESVRSTFGRHNQIFLNGLITKFSELWGSA